MKKFTDKQKETFLNHIRNGILGQLDEGDIKKIFESNEDLSSAVMGGINNNMIVNEYDLRGETVTLIKDLLKNCNLSDLKSILCSSNPKSGRELAQAAAKEYGVTLTVTLLKESLGLMYWATKSDILKALHHQVLWQID